MQRKILSGLLLVTATTLACGDNKAAAIDADRRPIDAAPDARPIDAPPAVFGGTVSLLEVSAFRAAGPLLGQGPTFQAGFDNVTALGAPVYDDTGGTPLGCRAWNLTAAQTAQAALGVDEGNLAVTVTQTTPTAPLFPTCAYVGTAGYICPDLTTASGGGTIAAGAQGTATLTDADITYTAANAAGRYVRISGATNAANNGVFPIAAVGGANTIVYINPAVVAETIPAAGSHVNFAGAGPIPGAVMEPGFLADNAAVTIAHTAGGGNHIPAYSVTTGANGVGNHFTLDAAELAKFHAVPVDGSAFSIACTAANCPAGSADATVLQITTTDTAVTGLSEFAMPLPTTSSVRIQCGQLSLGAGATMTVPAGAMALLKNAATTTKRVRISFSRVALLSGNSPATVSTIAGHTVLGFTTPAN